MLFIFNPKRIIFREFSTLRKATTRFVVSVCLFIRPCLFPHTITRLPLDWFSLNLIFDYFSKLCRQNTLFRLNMTRITGTFNEDLCTFMTISCPVLLRMRNFADRYCGEYQNTHLMLKSSPPPRKSCRLWYNVENCCIAGETTSGNIILRVQSTCWISKTTNTHSEYVILSNFPRQQWLHERGSVLPFAISNYTQTTTTL